MHAKPRAAFTLVELLVVITIIGILVALLLPAVQSARESARRSQCANNLKQLSLAVLSYESQNGVFPPSLQYPQSEITRMTTSDQFGPNWVIMILPFIDQQPLYDAFDLTKSISNSANRSARGNNLAVMLCPTDQGRQHKFVGGPGSEGDNWARGNYGANGGAGMLLYNTTRADAIYGAESPGWKPTTIGGKTRPFYRGVMGPNVAVQMAHIRDGASNTFMLGELRVGVTDHDGRGVWAMGAPGASSLFGYAYSGDARGPNVCNDNSDDTDTCGYLEGTSPGLAALLDECMPCYAGGGNAQATARSLHIGGVFTAFCDGSVRFISNYIDCRGYALDATWYQLVCSADGYPVDQSKIE